MDVKLIQKIEKIKALIKQGVGGESAAAREALNRLIEKHNLDPKEVGDRKYGFKYSTNLELRLMVQINKCLFGDRIDLMKDTWGKREVVSVMEYSDYVAMDCAYEYFRRHMKAQWNKHCAPLIRRKRTPKTKKQMRERLQDAFFSKYIVESKLYLENQLKRIDHSKISEAEYQALSAVRDVQGGQYNEQVTAGLYLNQ